VERNLQRVEPKPNGKFELYLRSFDDCEYPKGLSILDPIFNIGFGYRSCNDRMSQDDYIEMLRKIPKPCVVIHYPEIAMNLFSKIWGEVDEVVSWVYPSNLGRQHRLICWYGCKPDFTKYGQPYRDPNDPRVKKYIEQGKMARLYDWWEVNIVKGNSKERLDHPCQMPLEVMRRIVKTTAKSGDVIIDPFSGTATTGVAAIENGNHFIGYEIDPYYYAISEKRLQEAAQLTLCDPCYGAMLESA